MGKISIANLKKTVYYLKRNGLKKTLSAVTERIGGRTEPEYRWVPPAPEMLRQQREQAATLSGVRFSIIVPAYRTPERYLREMLESVIRQTFPEWELILADATEDESVRRAAESYGDSRIRYLRLPANKGIAENTNEGIRLASGGYVGLLDHDDVLTENALYEMARAIVESGRQGVELRLLYSDEDKCDGDMHTFYDPHIKEKFNLDLLLSNNYICHFMVMERSLIQKLELRGEFEGAQDFDLVLRAAGQLLGQEEKICHIPMVLYHWRCHTRSTAENPRSKMYAYEAGRRAVQDFVKNRGWRAQVRDTEHLGFYRLVYVGNPLDMRPELGAIGGRVISGGKATKGGAAKDGATKGKATKGGAAKDGATKGGATKDKATKNKATKGGAAKDGATKNKAAKGRVTGGRMNEEGRILDEGLPASHSGYMHRAVLQQEAEALDIRNIELRRELRSLFAETLGIEYKTLAGTERFDVSALPEGIDPIRASLELSLAIRRRGYKLLYMPDE